MIRRNTWILLIILAALIGFSVYWTNLKTKQAALATPTSVSTVLFSPTDGSPSDIKISDSGGNTMEMARNASGTWGILAPTATTADSGSAEAAATQVSALRILDNVQLGPDVVGLDKPSYVITLTFTGGKTHKLNIGSVTPIQDGYYAQLDNLKIQIIDKQGIDALIGLLKDPPYAATLTPIASATATVLPETPTPAPTNTPPAPSPTITKSP